MQSQCLRLSEGSIHFLISLDTTPSLEETHPVKYDEIRTIESIGIGELELSRSSNAVFFLFRVSM